MASRTWPPEVIQGSGDGIVSINADDTAAQVLAVGTTGTDFAIVDNGTGTHTFNLPNASATARGVVSDSAQTFTGIKTFASAIYVIDGTSSAPGIAETSDHTCGINLGANGSNTGVQLVQGGVVGWSVQPSATATGNFAGPGSDDVCIAPFNLNTSGIGVYNASIVPGTPDLTPAPFKIGYFGDGGLFVGDAAGSHYVAGAVFGVNDPATGLVSYFSIDGTTGSIKQGNYHLEASENNAGNSSTAQTINWATGSAQLSTLTGSVTYTFSNPVKGGAYILRIATGAGSFTATWPMSVKWSGGTAPTITATAGRVDLINFYFDGTDYYGSFSQNYTP